MTFNTFLLSAVLILLSITNSTYAYREVIDLGTLGGDNSNALSINDNGQIVGWAEDSSGNRRACLFDRDRGFNVNLQGTSSPNSGIAYSINNKGKIVGVAGNTAYLFDSTTTITRTNLGTLGGFESCAYSINNTNRIVGWANNDYGVERGCRFDQTGGGANIDLGTLLGTYPDYDDSTANSINNYNHMVGWSRNRHRRQIACIFNFSSKIDKPLGTLSDYTYGSVANSINDNDQIIGFAADISGYSRACFFNQDDSSANINLGTLGGDYSEALEINNNSQIVGYAYNSLGNSRACLFDPTGQGNNIDLNTLIDPSSGWELLSAISINNNGWIVGSGINPDGDTHAYLLTPEPATVLLFGFGGMAILRRRKTS